MIIQGEEENDSSCGSDDILVTGSLKKTKSTFFGVEAEDHLDLDDFPIVFYEPKTKDKSTKSSFQQIPTPENGDHTKKNRKKKKHKIVQKKDSGRKYKSFFS